jgi:hypothetical protein
MSKKLTLSERWDMDSQEFVIYRCHRCKHNKGDDKCEIYNIIPKEIAKMKKRVINLKINEICSSNTF